MKKYIAVYGGTELTDLIADFVEDLCFSILENIPGTVLVTGGFHYSEKYPNAVSTDYAAYKGAKRFAEQNKMAISECFETWIPDPDKDRIGEGVERFRKGKVKVMQGKSSQARRFEIVQHVDAVITVKGKKHTAMLLDFALATNKPFFPLPFTGGDSFTYWKENDKIIRTTFGINKDLFKELLTIKLDKANAEKRRMLIVKIIEALANGIERTCLVLMSYKNEPVEFYENHLRKVIVKAGYKPINIKEEMNEGNILSIFLKKLQTTDVVIADITEANPNVMYELGQAHARKYPVLLFCRRKLDSQYRQVIPFYLSMDKIENDDTSTSKGLKNILGRIENNLLKKVVKQH